jgi:hypothetical protein
MGNVGSDRDSPMLIDSVQLMQLPEWLVVDWFPSLEFFSPGLNCRYEVNRRLRESSSFVLKPLSGSICKRLPEDRELALLRILTSVVLDERPNSLVQCGPKALNSVS